MTQWASQRLASSLKSRSSLLERLDFNGGGIGDTEGKRGPLGSAEGLTDYMESCWGGSSAARELVCMFWLQW